MKEQDREEWDMISLLMNQDGGFITASQTLQGAQAAETEAIQCGLKTRNSSRKVSGQAAYIWYLNLRTCHLLRSL